MSARILLLLAFSLLFGGCDSTAATQPSTTTTPATKSINPPSTQMTTLTGTLRGGMAAIGGETTGWTLIGDGAGFGPRPGHAAKLATLGLPGAVISLLKPGVEKLVGPTPHDSTASAST